ncbi:uncharacterized protein BJ212DRAFT_1483632 [Suillus subaureus]|uniref:Uncharacterized protein n=1 Tax=Suillus subaureus TaxID=48587 RepID=A0A9P7JAR7_9AGAM|nr:uncharacterized protein BJ212DRAFT_1483632 [Suillus subaureus]KAG1811385.1 hypothetical protein BJ212DRAFT_1483632 [Suillus subaureus]
MLSGKPLFPVEITTSSSNLGMLSAHQPWAGFVSLPHADYEIIFELFLPANASHSQTFSNANPLAVDFLTKTVSKKLWLTHILKHKYVHSLLVERTNLHVIQYNPNDEPITPPPDLEFFEVDLHKNHISREQLKELLHEEIVSFYTAPIVNTCP